MDDKTIARFWSKVEKTDVVAIRVAAGTQRQIAMQFAVSQQTVSDIKCRRRWKHLV